MNSPVIIELTAGAAFLLGFLLIVQPRKVNVIANRYLGLFVLTIGMAMIEIPLYYQDFHLRNPNLFELIGLIRFLTAPLLYISILYFTSFEKGFKRNILWHFLPFLIFCAFRFPFFITGQNLEFSAETRPIVFFILRTALPFQTLIYWILSWMILRNHIKNIRRFSSATEKIDLYWLRSFLLIILFLLLVWLNLLFFNLKYLIPYTPLLYLINIFFLAYFSLQQKEIFDFAKEDLKDLSSIKEQKNESPQRVAEARLMELDTQLQFIMNAEKLYLDNELNLPKLAKKLNASCNETSFVINRLYGDNFYNFINKYRVEEAKKMLLSEKYNQLNILGIAYESGFNSKTTFNTTFKKHTGLSPRDFVKSNTIIT